MKFEIVYSGQAEKQLSGIHPKAALRIMKGCERLRTSPFPDEKHVKKMKGYDRPYRSRVGDYRIVFRFSGNLVEIIDIISKQDFQKAY